MKQVSVNINPHAIQPTSIYSLIGSLWTYRQLIVKMTRREVVGRYKGSIIGLAWSFFNPIFMLAVYTIVFSMIFKARWSLDGEGSKTQFALILFVGIIVLNLFSEVINRAPSLILFNVNYVKKVVFPIEILPIISMGAALFHAFISFGVLLIAFFGLNGFLNWTIIYIPIIFLPLVILSLGLSWGLSSIGVFIRDVGQTIGLLITLLMFLSPVFYPISAVPPKLQKFIMVNPLTFIIEQLRIIIINGQQPNWLGVFFYYAIALLVMWIGYVWFQKTRNGFADVL